MTMQNRIKNVDDYHDIYVLPTSFFDVYLKHGIITVEEYNAVWNGKAIMINSLWVVISKFIIATQNHEKSPRPQF